MVHNKGIKLLSNLNNLRNAFGDIGNKENVVFFQWAHINHDSMITTL